MIRLLVRIVIALAGADLIGSGLTDGVRLVYESGGIAQEPWIYDSVRVVADEAFERCVVVARRGQSIRMSCARGDTLFERGSDGSYRAARPLGESMELQVPGRGGTVSTFTTGMISTRRVQGKDVRYLPTAILTRDSAGAITRPLTEQYAPSLLTALSGTFETPAPGANWRVTSEFSLVAILNGASRN